MSADTGTSSAATIRAMTAAARSAPSPAPSGTPRDQATPALVVAIAFAPAPAIATTSAGVAWSLGVPDGAGLGAERAAAVIARIVAALDVPVSADIEAGDADVAATVP